MREKSLIKFEVVTPVRGVLIVAFEDQFVFVIDVFKIDVAIVRRLN